MLYSTVSTRWAVLRGNAVCSLYVHSLMVHMSQTHPETTHLSPPGQLIAVATAPWPSTVPAPRWPPAGHCLPGAGRNQSTHASDGLLPHWPTWPPTGRSASTDHREQSTAQSWPLLTHQRGIPRIWEERRFRKTSNNNKQIFRVSLSSNQCKNICLFLLASWDKW